MSVSIPSTSLKVALWLVTPSSNKNLYKAWPSGVFLRNNCGCIAPVDFLRKSTNFLGLPAKYNKLPLCSVVKKLEVKFLIWVTGPNTVLPTCVKPFGTKTKYLYTADFANPVASISSPCLIASAHSFVVNNPSNGEV